MLEYKISEWQIDKLREVIKLLENRTDLTKEQLDLYKQGLLILEAIEHTQGTEMEPVLIPSVWIADGEVHSKPEDYYGVSTYASTATEYQ